MGTMINSYSVGLTLNASDYINKSQLSAQETRKLSRSIEAARSPAERFSMEQDRLSKALNAGAISQQVHNRLLDAAKQKHMAAGMAAKKNAMEHQSLVNQLGGMRTQIASLRTNPAFLATAAAITSITAAVTGAIVVMKSAHKEIDEHAKAARKLGMTYSSLQGIKFAGAEIAGASGEQITRAIQQMQVRIAKAAEGDATIKKAFAKIGVDAGNAMAAGPVESIKMIAKGMDGLNTQSEKLNATTELFGRGGAEIVSLLTSGSDVLAESIEFQEKWNGLSEQQVRRVEAANDAWGRVGTVVDGVTKQLAAEMAPAMEMIANDALKMAGAMGDPRVKSFLAGGSLAAVWGGIKDAQELTTLGIRAGAKAMKGDFAGVGDAIRSAFSLQHTEDAMQEFFAIRSRLQKSLKDREDTGEALAEQARITDEFDKQIQALEHQAVLYIEGEHAANRLRLISEGYSESQIERLERQQEFVKGLKDEADALKKVATETERLQKAAETAFGRDIEQSLKAAQSFFESERKKDEKIRADVSKGPGAGMEAGSEAAAKFMADQINMAIGAGIPEKPTPGDVQLLAEAAKQLQVLQDQRTAQDRLAAAFEQFVAGQQVAERLGDGAEVAAAIDREMGAAAQAIENAAATFVQPEPVERPRIDSMDDKRSQAIAEQQSRQTAVLERSQQMHDRLLGVAKDHLAVAKENGFKRIR